MTETASMIIAILLSFLIALTVSEELYKFWHKAVMQLMNFSIKKFREMIKNDI